MARHKLLEDYAAYTDAARRFNRMAKHMGFEASVPELPPAGLNPGRERREGRARVGIAAAYLRDIAKDLELGLLGIGDDEQVP